MKKILIIVLALLVSACVPKSELEQAQADNGALREQMAQSQQQIAQLQESLQAANSMLQEANSRLAATETELSKKPTMPVNVSFRKAMMGAGYVAVFNTTIKEDFPVLVTVKSKALGTVQQFPIHLSHAVAKQIGHLEGVVLDIGDEITVENTNYEPLSIIATP